MRTVRLRLLTAAAVAAVFYSGMSYLAAAQSPSEEYATEPGMENVATDDGIAVYSRQISRHPKNYVLYLRRAVSLVAMKDYDGALEDLTHAAKLSPNRLTAENLGDKRWDSSVPETHAWLLDKEIHVMRADVLERLNRFDEALPDLDYAVKLDPQQVDNLHARGVARTLVGQYDGAIADFDAVLARHMVVDSLFARGIAKYLKEDWQGSKEDFTRAAKISPTNTKVAEWLQRVVDKTRELGIYMAENTSPTLATRDFYPVAYEAAGLN